MHRLRIVVLALMAVFALAAAMSASASAAVLPEFTTETGGTVTAGSGEFTSSASAIECTSLSSGTLAAENKRLGTYTFDFSTCKAVVFGVTLGCKSLGDVYIKASEPAKGGTILNNGSWHLVRGPKGSPIAQILLLIKETHLECSNNGLTITALILVRGNVGGTISPTKTPTKSFKVEIKTTAAKGTTQKVTEFENDGGTIVKTGLESSTNGGAFEKAGESSEPATLTTPVETEIIES